MRYMERGLMIAMVAACLAVAAKPGSATAQVTAGPVRSPSMAEARWRATEGASHVGLALGHEYRANNWKTGLLVGAGVGVLLGSVILATCDSDANNDCPGWGRAGLAVGVGTGLGALIGAVIPNGASKAGASKAVEASP